LRPNIRVFLAGALEATTTGKSTIKGKPAAAAPKRAEPSKRAGTERASTPGHIVEAREFRSWPTTESALSARPASRARSSSSLHEPLTIR